MAEEIKINVPDIGGTSHVDVIEILVKVGDVINEDTSLITLESDKASMEIPSPKAGTVRSLCVRVGDKVSEGDAILMLETASTAPPKASPETEKTTAQPAEKIAPILPESEAASVKPPVQQVEQSDDMVFAGPAVRRLARELGVSLSSVQGTGRKARISKDDVTDYVKSQLQRRSPGALELPLAPSIDFTVFGEIEKQPLSKIKRLTGVNVHRAWMNIPHVTQFDEADITDLEAFRMSELDKAKAAGVRLTLLAFVCKVVSKALAMFPQFNASLDATGDFLILKHYCNVGIAVETPQGLVVPVIKNVNSLSVSDIAKEMARLSTKAREKGLLPTEMSGGCFTISSLGGIGGTAFTPIVNSPEVAILGLSRASMKPVYTGEAFQPRLMLPLSLSYDHRVIDGAEAARFTQFLSEHLADIRRLLV
jgi:pyruvate dehydrogenase E2 component (dihydrolipoamide acetyltransferase)